MTVATFPGICFFNLKILLITNCSIAVPYVEEITSAHDEHITYTDKTSN